MKNWICKLLGHSFFQAEGFGSICTIFCERCGEIQSVHVDVMGKLTNKNKEELK